MTGSAGGGERGGAATREPRRGAAPEHPALRERRRGVARAEGRRRRSRLLWLMGVLAALAFAYWALTGPLLAVHGVRVAGYERPDRDRVVEALTAAAERGGIVSPPRAEMERAVRPFPWVEDITVVREWPRALGVQVVQARPIALARRGDGGSVLISTRGRVLEEIGDAPRLGWVSPAVEPPAPGGTLPAGQAEMLGFLAALDPDLAARVRDLGMDGAGTLNGRLEDGPELRLGRPVRLAAKATALEMVLGALPADEREAAAYVDLSVPEHPAVGGFEDEAPVEDATPDQMVDTDGDGIPDTLLSTLYGDPSRAPADVLDELSGDGSG